ncbi:MAG: hypothetical protein JJ979_25935 [Roseibium sp.]|nr:hypothetical protein [Roseibium sp.]
MTAAVDFAEVKLPFSFPLPTKNGQNLLYLEKRGITGELASYFHLRCCLEGWWNFIDEDGKPSGQKFDNRIIIPVFNLDGDLVTFQGRDLSGTSAKKYLFPKMLPGTGRYLYNGQNFGKAKRAVLGEGAFDVAAIKLAFDEDESLRDIAPMGTFGKHLSYGQDDGTDQLGALLELKRRGLEEVTIMWDGEWKALISALDACRQIQRIGLRSRVALLPAGKDPNEVPGHVVRQAFYKAHPYSAKTDVKFRLRNPFRNQ